MKKLLDFPDENIAQIGFYDQKITELFLQWFEKIGKEEFVNWLVKQEGD
jgi:hypothetical protein